MPHSLARREALKAKLDAACARMEANARADAARPTYDAKHAAYDAKTGWRGRPPNPSDWLSCSEPRAPLIWAEANRLTWLD